MKGKKLILHIGTEKTGTTSIQYQLYSNYENLLEQGVLYPKTLLDQYRTHSKLACFTVYNEETERLCKVIGIPNIDVHVDFKKKLVSEFEDELKSFKGETVVTSNEHLSAFILEIEDIKYLKDFLYKYFDDITVVIYIREQIDHLCSSYNTRIISGGQLTFYGARNLRSELKRLDHEQTLNNWAEVFGKENLVVRLFDRDFLKNGDIFEDFAYICKINIDSSELLSLNKILNLKQVEFFRRVNMYLPYLANDKLNEKRDGLVQFIESLDIDSPKIRDLVTEEYLDIFKESNENIKNMFFKDRENLFKPFKLLEK